MESSSAFRAELSLRVTIPTLRIDFMDVPEKELEERGEELTILKERLKAAKEDHELFVEKLKEVEK